MKVWQPWQILLDRLLLATASIGFVLNLPENPNLAGLFGLIVVIMVFIGTEIYGDFLKLKKYKVKK